MHEMCIKEHASRHDEERAQFFVGTSFAENGQLYRVISASRDRAKRLLLASVREGASMAKDSVEVTPEDEQEELLTVTEVAKVLRVDTTTVRRWIRDGTLEAVMLPTRGERHTYRIRKATIDAMLEGGQP